VDNKKSSNSQNNVSSLFLDFGMSFSKANSYFSEFLQPRKLNGIMDFIELGMLPKIKGIYREDYLKHCGLKSCELPCVDGILSSHAQYGSLSIYSLFKGRYSYFYEKEV
jgi:ribonuclease J